MSFRAAFTSMSAVIREASASTMSIVFYGQYSMGAASAIERSCAQSRRVPGRDPLRGRAEVRTPCCRLPGREPAARVDIEYELAMQYMLNYDAQNMCDVVLTRACEAVGGGRSRVIRDDQAGAQEGSGPHPPPCEKYGEKYGESQY